MLYFYFYILLSLIFSVRCILRSWSDINLHCRDNENNPVDWWFLNKPPGPIAPYHDSGRNYSFITSSETSGRWQVSDRLITSNTMLSYTLSPMHRATYVDYVAYMVIESRPIFNQLPGSTTSAVLLADLLGGLIIIHNLPGFPDVNRDRPYFPEAELGYGHMVGCVSLDMPTLKEIAAHLAVSGSQITYMQIPSSMINTLSDWVDLYKNIEKKNWDSEMGTTMEFISKGGLLHVGLMARRPGSPKCIYQNFAKKRGLILDVYAPNSKPMKNYCTAHFGIRKIESISLKVTDDVTYIDNSTDKTRFAVSTTAHWQAKGGSSEKYWSCLGTLDNQDMTRRGGTLMCFESNQLWFSFDNLKVKEPKCN